MSKFITVLDVGSSKITALAAEKVGGDFVVKALGKCDYNGFDENGFYEPESLSETVRAAVEQVERKLNFRVKHLTVGVPGNFCNVVTNDSTSAFRSPKKLEEADVEEVLNKADVYGSSYGVRLDRRAVGYIVDGSTRTLDPVGRLAQRLTATVCFTFATDYFVKVFDDALRGAGIYKYSYVSATEQQALFVSSQCSQDGYAIVIDVGYLTTDVSLSGGKSLLFGKTFCLGSGYIAADLHQVLHIDYDAAVALLGKINLKLEFNDGDVYEVAGGSVDAQNANEIVKARIEQFAAYVKKCFSYCDCEIPYDTPILLTGGGLTYVKGAADWLAYYLGKKVQIFKSVDPQTDRNELSSAYGLTKYAVARQTENGGVMSLLKRLIGGKK